MSYTSMLKHTAAVYRDTSSSNAYGMGDTSWAATYTTLKCLVQAASGLLTRVRSGQQVNVSHNMFVPNGTDILEGDLVVHAGRCLRVVFVDHDAAGQDHHLEVNLAEPEYRCPEGVLS
jgi:hypothetical protein